MRFSSVNYAHPRQRTTTTQSNNDASVNPHPADQQQPPPASGPTHSCQPSGSHQSSVHQQHHQQHQNACGNVHHHRQPDPQLQPQTQTQPQVLSQSQIPGQIHRQSHLQVQPQSPMRPQIQPRQSLRSRPQQHQYTDPTTYTHQYPQTRIYPQTRLQTRPQARNKPQQQQEQKLAEVQKNSGSQFRQTHRQAQAQAQIQTQIPAQTQANTHAQAQAHAQALGQMQSRSHAQCSKSQISPLKPPLPPTSSLPQDYFRTTLASTTRGISPSSTIKDSIYDLRINPRVHSRPSLYTYISLVLLFILIILRRNYRSTMLTSLTRQNVRIPNEPRHALRLHIFTAPKPYIGPDRALQLRALESWLALTPKPEITLFGDHPTIQATAHKYHVRHDEQIETSFLGVPLLNSILYTIVNRTMSHNNPHRKSETFNDDLRTITVFLNADVVIFDDFILAMRKLRASYSEQTPWLAIAARWDISSSLAKFLPINGPNKRNNDRNRVSAAKHVRVHGTLRTFGGVDLWAWERAPSFGLVPPFAIGRGRYDNWLTHVLIQARTHEVIDISEAVTIAHIRHDHHLVVSSDSSLMSATMQSNVVNVDDLTGTGGREFWSVQARRGFETVINALLAASAHGEYRPQMGTVLHAPNKLTSCYEAIPLCLFVRRRPHSCRCEHSAFVTRAHNDPYVVSGSNVVFCGLLSSNAGAAPLDERARWAITGRLDDDSSSRNDSANADSNGEEESDVDAKIFGMPLTRKAVLSTVGNRTRSNLIILVIADYSERMFVMQTVCSMRNAKIFQWLVVVALDDDMYRFCLLQGLAVYLVDYDDSGISNHITFRQLARLQSVFEIIQKRRHNILSVFPGSTFVTSPWPYLSSFIDASYDVAIIPSENFTSNAHASASALFVRPTNAAMNLLKLTMAEMERNTSAMLHAGHVLWNMACGPNGEQLSRRARRTCQFKYSAKTYLLDISRFRSIANPTCETCSKWNAGAPIMLLPYRLPQPEESSWGSDSGHKALAQQIKASGFSAYEDGHCLWFD